jgi:hypothetical protein
MSQDRIEQIEFKPSDGMSRFMNLIRDVERMIVQATAIPPEFLFSRIDIDQSLRGIERATTAAELENPWKYLR